MSPCAVKSTRCLKTTYKHMLLARVWGTGWLLNHAFYGMSVCRERAEATFDRYLHGSGPLRMEAWSREFGGCVQYDAICMVSARSVGDVCLCESVAYVFDRYLHSFQLLQMELSSWDFGGCVQNAATSMVSICSVGEVLSCYSVVYVFEFYLHGSSSIKWSLGLFLGSSWVLSGSPSATLAHLVPLGGLV